MLILPHLTARHWGRAWRGRTEGEKPLEEGALPLVCGWSRVRQVVTPCGYALDHTVVLLMRDLVPCQGVSRGCSFGHYRTRRCGSLRGSSCGRALRRMPCPCGTMSGRMPSYCFRFDGSAQQPQTPAVPLSQPRRRPRPRSTLAGSGGLTVWSTPWRAPRTTNKAVLGTANNAVVVVVEAGLGHETGAVDTNFSDVLEVVDGKHFILLCNQQGCLSAACWKLALAPHTLACILAQRLGQA